MNTIIRNQPLKAFNTFRLDTKASYYARPEDVESLCKILEEERFRQMPLLVLGEGSNVLFRKDYPGLVLQAGIKGIALVEDKGEEVVVRVGAMENWDHWVGYSITQGWFGLENLSSIPGSVGASPVQNIGAYGVELKDRFAWLEAWDLHEGRQVRLEHLNCHFAYRSSIFKTEASGRYIITNVAFRLSRNPQLKLDYGNVEAEFRKAGGNSAEDLRRVIAGIRKNKLPDPDAYGNAGSFFKNPRVDKTIFNCIRVEYPHVPFFPEMGNQVKIPAAWLIEKAGWKGVRLGNVGTWPDQPLVIVNYGGATGQEIYDFSERIIEDVENTFGISLEREVNVI